MPTEAYTLTRPIRQETSVVFASPHSGRDYPPAFLAAAQLGAQALRSSEDAFVDQLFDAAPRFGAPLLAARVPRAYIDLNRAADELDASVIEGISRAQHNPRVSSGLGVIPRVVSGGRAIYRGKLSIAEAEHRLRDCWHPYHQTLRSLLEATLADFGEAILIDCHSMPHEAIESHVRPGTPRPDVVLGDRFGAASGQDIVDRIESAFVSAGLRVARNSPFAGAYITQAYGRPSRGQHVIQVEIDRGLYMDETTIAPLPDFADFRRLLTGVISDITSIGRVSLPLAAE